MKLGIIGLIIGAAVLTGCATTSGQTDGAKKQSTADSGMRCKKAMRVGSNIASRRCRTKAQEKQEREEAQEAMGSMQGGTGRTEKL